MLPLDTIYNEDCLQGMRRMGDGTVDCRSLRPALPAGEPGRRLLVEELAARRSTLRVSEGRVMLASTMPKSAIKREQSSWLELPSVSRLAVRQREQARPTGQRRTRRKTLATEGTQETRGENIKEQRRPKGSRAIARTKWQLKELNEL